MRCRAVMPTGQPGLDALIAVRDARDAMLREAIAVGEAERVINSALPEHMQQVGPESERGEGQYGNQANRNDPNHELENYTPAEHSQDGHKEYEYLRVMHGCSPPHEEDACDDDECQDGQRREHVVPEVVADSRQPSRHRLMHPVVPAGCPLGWGQRLAQQGPADAVRRLRAEMSRHWCLPSLPAVRVTNFIV
jgi:hypothetical protein